MISFSKKQNQTKTSSSSSTAPTDESSCTSTEKKFRRGTGARGAVRTSPFMSKRAVAIHHDPSSTSLADFGPTSKVSFVHTRIAMEREEEEGGAAETKEDDDDSSVEMKMKEDKHHGFSSGEEREEGVDRKGGEGDEAMNSEKTPENKNLEDARNVIFIRHVRTVYISTI